MQALGYAILLQIASLPVTTLLKVKGINVNALPLQVVVIGFMFFCLFQINTKKGLSLLLKYSLPVLGAFYLITVFTYTSFPNVVMNVLALYCVLIVPCSILWPTRPMAVVKIDLILKYFFVILALITAWLLFEHVSTLGWNKRFKAFGSGTIHALLCILGACFHIDRLTNKKKIDIVSGIVAGVLVVGLFATQSRGVLLTFALFTLILVWNRFRPRHIFLLLCSVVCFVAFGLSSEVADIPVFSRFKVKQGEDLQSFTSGRLETQKFILEQYSQASSLKLILFGHGLNSMKTLPTRYGFEFPHFDPLYVLYEGGVLLLSLYIFSLYRFVAKSRDKFYPMIWVVSSLHTNMVVSPYILFLVYLLSLHRVVIRRELKLRRKYFNPRLGLCSNRSQKQNLGLETR